MTNPSQEKITIQRKGQTAVVVKTAYEAVWKSKGWKRVVETSKGGLTTKETGSEESTTDTEKKEADK